jgi:aminoglycoside phosphotransferase family enzyme
VAGPASGTVRRYAPGLRAKVVFLSDPASYPEKPATVEVVQTHMSCVFLTDRHAYKLKKPVRYDFLDFSTLKARRVDCEEELRLNRRLAGDVYVDVVPLVSTGHGGLALGGDGKVVDWLVKMRRLPARLMLDRAIRDGQVGRDDVRRFTLVLADFYRRSVPVVMDANEYRDRYRVDILANRRALAVPDYGLSPSLLESVTTGLLAVLEKEALSFDLRIAGRRIVEGHGDLRPEHVFLGPEPLFIDCLEFDSRLRTLDPADELSGLAMECEYAGVPWIGTLVLDTYREATGDDPPASLVGFYKGFRAAVRAKLSAWHLRDPLEPADQGKWITRARRYLEWADRHVRAACDTGN